MINMRVAALVSLVVVLGCQPVLGQTSFTYRGHALGTSIASVIKISGARESDLRTLHERPARIQELVWRPPSYLPRGERGDSVREVLFRFYDDQLFQLVVSYDRDRMEGLTNDDLIEAVSATYGVPLLVHRQTPRTTVPSVVPAETTIVARWDDAASLLTLSRGIYSPQVELVLISKTLSARAEAAINEAVRLDAEEAPQRAVDQRNKDVDDARMATAKARVINKAGFKP